MAAKTKVVKNAKAKNAAPAKAATGLPKPALRVLKIIAASKGGLTRPKVAEKVSKMGIACYNGRISNETLTYKMLVDGGYVKPVDVKDETAGINETVYVALAKGKAEAAKKN